MSGVRVYGEEIEELPVEFGIKQGCVLSPTLFNYCIDCMLEMHYLLIQEFRLYRTFHLETMNTLMVS